MNKEKDYTKWFVHKTRDDGSEFYCLHDNCSAEHSLYTLIYSIHNVGFYDCLPNDWIYKNIYMAFDRLQECCCKSDFENACEEIYSDWNHFTLLEWAKWNWAQEMIQEQFDEVGGFKDIFTPIRYAQENAIHLIYQYVWNFIQENKSTEEYYSFMELGSE